MIRQFAGFGADAGLTPAEDIAAGISWLQNVHREVIARRQLYGPRWWLVAPLRPDAGYGTPEIGCPPGPCQRCGMAPVPQMGLELQSPELVRKLIGMVMAHEGDYDSVNRNTDGAGASIGIFQWPQRSGGLGQVLKGYYRANPTLFAQIFGPHWKTLLERTAAASMQPIDGANLWQEPWVSRFVRAGRQPEFQAVQDRMAAEGPFIKAAFAAADALGFTTERALAVTLDAAVSQGPEFAQKVASAVRTMFSGQTVPMSDVLDAYLDRSIAHFRSTSAPKAPPKAQHLTWRKVGREWHIYAGQVDLYASILNRRGKFVADASLSDDLLDRQRATV